MSKRSREELKSRIDTVVVTFEYCMKETKALLDHRIIGPIAEDDIEHIVEQLEISVRSHQDLINNIRLVSSELDE